MPTILADNGGHDSSDLVAKLRAAHYEGQSDAGLGESRPAVSFSPSSQRADSLHPHIHPYSHHCSTPFARLFSDMDKGEIASMRKLGVTESYKLKKQVVVSASEAAEMILR